MLTDLSIVQRLSSDAKRYLRVEKDDFFQMGGQPRDSENLQQRARVNLRIISIAWKKAVRRFLSVTQV